MRRLAVFTAVTAWLWGCSDWASESTQGDEENQRALHRAAQSESPGPTAGDGPSAQAAVVVWADDAEAGPVDEVAFEVRNTMSKILDIEIVIIGVDPFGQTATRPLDRRSLAARDGALFSVPVDELPAQSLRLASSVMIVAHYLQFDPRSAAGEAGQDVRRQFISDTKHATFEPGFRSAIVRSEKEQLAWNKESFLPSAPPAPEPGEVRLYSAARDTVEAIDPRTLPEKNAGVTFATKRPYSPEPAESTAIDQ